MGLRKLKGLTKADLERMYFAEGMSQWDIARHYKVTQGAIFYWFRKFKIRSRSHDDSLILFGKSGRFTGPNNPKWNGGRIPHHGYTLLRRPDHPRSDRRGYVREHIIVWEEHYGPVPNGHDVHHKNGKKDDNRITNL